MDKTTTQIPLRLPNDLYDVLRREAFDQRISMNKLAVRAISESLVVYKKGKSNARRS